MASKFNEDACTCLTENYEKGLPLKYCADIAGVARSTVYNWMEKGKQSKRGKYHDFYLDMQRAKSKFIAHHQLKIAESKDWRASQYLLQVTDTEKYVVTEKKQVQADVKTDILAKLERPLPELEDDD